jgi:hypothetical protein
MTNGKLIIVSTLFTLALGCQTPAEKQGNERAEARKEINDAADKAEKKIESAAKDLDDAKAEFGEKVADANKELADEQNEARKEIAEADKDAAEKLAEDRYARFEIIKNESEAEFATRADAAITRLQTDFDAAKLRTKTAANEDLTEDLDAAGTAIAEAKKDLTELRSKTGKVFDDGRLGVGTAINKAQRNLSDAYEEMASLKM